MRLPTCNETERALLGHLLEYQEDILRWDWLKPEHFHHELHRDLCGIIQDLAKRETAFAYAEVLDRLKEAGHQVTRDEILDIVDAGCVRAAADHHASAVYRASRLRHLIRLLYDGVEKAGTWTGGVEDLLAQIQLGLDQAGGGNAVENCHTLDDLLISVATKIQAGEQEGLMTGYRSLDAMTTGFYPGEMIVIAGRPSMGKTAFAMNIVERVAAAGSGVAVFSIEVEPQMLAQNLWASSARVNAQNLRTRALTEDDWEFLVSAAEAINHYGKRVIFDATPGINLAQIQTRSRQIARKIDLQLVVVDYLQLIEGSGNGPRYEEVSKISRGMKRIARELQVPVVALAQLNRSVAGREDRRPRLDDLRDSGAIEQDADLVLLLHRPEYYEPGNKSLEGDAEVIIAKQRHGPTGVLPMRFEREFMRFTEVMA